MEKEQKDVEQKGKAGKSFSIAGFEGFEALVVIVMAGVAYALCNTGIIKLSGASSILFMMAVGFVAALVAHFSGKLVAFLRGSKHKDEEAIVEDIITRKKDMAAKDSKGQVCYLCGESIEDSPKDTGLKLSMDHVPPKLFYPKAIRQQEDLNLERAPSHNKCNEDYRKDEEYFYHALYPLVAENNPSMGKIILQDLRRKAHKPQTPAMIRHVLKNVSGVTQGGIHLPPGKVVYDLDEVRLQNIAIKIARGVLALNKTVYISESNCFDLRFCENESEVIELYQLLWKISPAYTRYPKVFSYRYFYLDNKHHLCLFFWESFMYCLCFNGNLTNQKIQ